MRLFVVSKSGRKIYLNAVFETRDQLRGHIGSPAFSIKDVVLKGFGVLEIFNINNVCAESHDRIASGALAGALILGMLGGLIAGLAGLMVGAIIGAIIGKKSDMDEQKRVDKFNSSR